MREPAGQILWICVLFASAPVLVLFKQGQNVIINPRLDAIQICKSKHIHWGREFKRIENIPKNVHSKCPSKSLSEMPSTCGLSALSHSGIACPLTNRAENVDAERHSEQNKTTEKQRHTETWFSQLVTQCYW
jgi:hypothetical protein